MVKALERFDNYMFNMPKRAESVPKPFRSFMSEEDMRRMVEDAPKAGEGIKKLIREIRTAEEQITDLYRFQ